MKGMKTGGRKKGTPNVTTVMNRKVIANLLTDYQNSGLMDEDFKSLEPRDRLLIAEKMMQYTMPKMQATSIDIQENGSGKTIEERLAELSRDPDE